VLVSTTTTGEWPLLLAPALIVGILKLLILVVDNTMYKDYTLTNLLSEGLDMELHLMVSIMTLMEL